MYAHKVTYRCPICVWICVIQQPDHTNGVWLDLVGFWCVLLVTPSYDLAQHSDLQSDFELMMMLLLFVDVFQNSPVNRICLVVRINISWSLETVLCFAFEIIQALSAPEGAFPVVLHSLYIKMRTRGVLTSPNLIHNKIIVIALTKINTKNREKWHKSAQRIETTIFFLFILIRYFSVVQKRFEQHNAQAMNDLTWKSVIE